MHVVIAHYNEDLSWVTNLRYPFTILSRNGLPKNTAPNKANEASVFLEYILKYYNELDEYTVFIHAHRTSWHHEAPIDETINNLVCLFPYCNLNDFTPSLIRKCSSTLRQMQEEYPRIEPILGPIDYNQFSFRLGAQFYVHRNAIRSRSWETYKALYDVIMNGEGKSFEDGLLFERVWHFIFTNEVTDNNAHSLHLFDFTPLEHD